MEWTWNWEHFSLDGYDGHDIQQDLSATSGSFRLLLANLASQHLYELRELQELVMEEQRSAEQVHEKLQRLTDERDSLQEQLENLDTLQARSKSQQRPAPAPPPQPRAPRDETEWRVDAELARRTSSPLGSPLRENEISAAGVRLESKTEATEDAKSRMSVHKAHSTLTQKEKTDMLVNASKQLAGEDHRDDYAEFALTLDDSCTGRFTRLLLKPEWELAVAILILLNVVSMASKLQFTGLDVGYQLGFPGIRFEAEALWPGGGAAFQILDVSFTLFFALDILLRVILLGRYFWSSYFNWFDTLVVLSSLLELVWKEMINTTVLRLLRILKLGRSVRLMKMSAVLEAPRSILRCIAACFTTLFWSLSLLVVIQCIFAMLLMHAVEAHLKNDEIDQDGRIAVFRYYGTFSRTMLTMFEVLFANWVPSCRILVESVSEWFSLAFILYRCLIGFAVLNVVNAVFIQQTMKVAQADQEYIIMQKQKANQQLVDSLQRLFLELDSSGDGLLTWEEFSVIMTDPRMAALVASIEVEAHDLELLFKLLDDGDGEVQREEFSQGVLSIKGPAKALDVAHLLSIGKRLEKKLDSLQVKGKKGPGPASTSTTTSTIQRIDATF